MELRPLVEVRTLGRESLRFVPYLALALLIFAGGWWFGASRATTSSDTPFAGTLRNLNGTNTVACVYPPGQLLSTNGNWCGDVVIGSRALPPLQEGMQVHSVVKRINDTTVLVLTP
jgi:hypothetical protein